MRPPVKPREAAFWMAAKYSSAERETRVRRSRTSSTKSKTCSGGIIGLTGNAVMTALPVKPMIPPEQVLLFVEEVRDRLTLVSLSADEYFAAIQNAASRGFTGGRIYDALLLASAAKCKAQAVYTWNLRHYQSLAPGLARRIQAP